METGTPVLVHFVIVDWDRCFGWKARREEEEDHEKDLWMWLNAAAAAVTLKAAAVVKAWRGMGGKEKVLLLHRRGFLSLQPQSDVVTNWYQRNLWNGERNILKCESLDRTTRKFFYSGDNWEEKIASNQSPWREFKGFQVTNGSLKWTKSIT